MHAPQHSFAVQQTTRRACTHGRGAQAERQQELAGDAGVLHDRVGVLEGELATCRQALMDLEAAGLEKDRHIAELVARHALGCLEGQLQGHT